jgi:hypothetical protein
MMIEQLSNERNVPSKKIQKLVIGDIAGRDMQEFAGDRLRRKESTKSPSFVITMRDSAIAIWTMTISVDALASGRSRV